MSLIYEPFILVCTLSTQFYSLFPLVVSIFGTRNVLSFLLFFTPLLPPLMLLPRISSFYFLPHSFLFHLPNVIHFNALPQDPAHFEMFSDYSTPQSIFILNVPHLLSFRFSLNYCILKYFLNGSLWILW